MLQIRSGPGQLEWGFGVYDSIHIQGPRRHIIAIRPNRYDLSIQTPQQEAHHGLGISCIWRSVCRIAGLGGRRVPSGFNPGFRPGCLGLEKGFVFLMPGICDSGPKQEVVVVTAASGDSHAPLPSPPSPSCAILAAWLLLEILTRVTRQQIGKQSLQLVSPQFKQRSIQEPDICREGANHVLTR